MPHMYYSLFIFIAMIFLTREASLQAMGEIDGIELVVTKHYTQKSTIESEMERDAASHSASTSSSLPVIRYRSSVNDEVGECLCRLREHVAEGFNAAIALELLESAPDYSRDPNAVYNRYQSVELIGEGFGTKVWKAVLNIDSPSSGLKVGDIIAVRVINARITRPVNNLSLLNIEAHIRCTLLRNAGKDKGPLTEYFPDLYGLFYGPSMEEAYDPDDLESTKARTQGSAYQYQEMEFIERTFEFTRGIPDSIIFEYALGEWAARALVGLYIRDESHRNFGLKTVSYGRYYHFGEDHYYFPPGQMPVRYDLDSFKNYPLPPTKRFGGCDLDSKNAKTSEGKKFIEAFYQRGVEIPDIFTLFQECFGGYKKDSEWVQRHDPTARNYYLDETLIDRERSLPAEFLPV